MTEGKAQKASEAVDALAKKAQQLFASEEAGAALELVDEGLAREEHIRLWRLKARLLVFFERDAEATAILARVLPTAWFPGFWEVAQSGLAQSYVLLSKAHKVAYFPVRKCSSTSLHNVMAVLNGHAPKGENVHDNVRQYHVIKRDHQREHLAGYYSVLVVRSPVDRIRSFYQGNIVGRDHLVRDTDGKERFYGLNTKPSYEEFLADFHGYRRTFLTVRNHTDPLTRYVGGDVGAFDWIGNVRETDVLIDQLSERTGAALPQLHDMQAGTRQVPSPATAERDLETFYADDYTAFGAWF